jgi:hypothetical protein
MNVIGTKTLTQLAFAFSLWLLAHSALGSEPQRSMSAFRRVYSHQTQSSSRQRPHTYTRQPVHHKSSAQLRRLNYGLMVRNPYRPSYTYAPSYWIYRPRSIYDYPYANFHRPWYTYAPAYWTYRPSRLGSLSAIDRTRPHAFHSYAPSFQPYQHQWLQLQPVPPAPAPASIPPCHSPAYQ